FLIGRKWCVSVLSIALGLVFIAMPGPAFAQNAASLDDTARLLAGLPVTGPLAGFTQDQRWQGHAAAMDKAWKTKEYFQLEPIAAWMGSHASAYYHSTGPMYYMFGGPDFLYANAFFPDASTYILAGLEPVGQVPDLSRMNADALSANLGALRNSMTTLLVTHYFVTEEMKSELGRSNLTGTIPILYVFLARLGCTILDTNYVHSPAEGVKISFSRNGRTQTLYYFKTDLSGGGSGFLRWCGSHGVGVSLIKAASYLMHGDGFSGVRNFLLEHSALIVQDDSGIPLRAFNKSWEIEFYGRFIPHGEKFGKYDQVALAEIYHRNPPPPALGFAFGYWWQAERGILMLARRK
ncbi:MAG TPA: hypothetical protein VFA58_08810, partial [Chthoniobacterales bacterium]|nr:hypothetical protein [Chthoniobacterales bacterium]